LIIPAITTRKKANALIGTLYCETVIKKGNTLTRLAKLAPAPKLTNNAGKAQQIKVEVEANKEKKLVFCTCKWLSCMLIPDDLYVSGVEAIV
tara:strand:- start:28 stop:303 length:276 start_codon:yes stop_codon:yes gene_type:complete